MHQVPNKGKDDWTNEWTVAMYFFGTWIFVSDSNGIASQQDLSSAYYVTRTGSTMAGKHNKRQGSWLHGRLYWHLEDFYEGMRKF